MDAGTNTRHTNCPPPSRFLPEKRDTTSDISSFIRRKRGIPVGDQSTCSENDKFERPNALIQPPPRQLRPRKPYYSPNLAQIARPAFRYTEESTLPSPGPGSYSIAAPLSRSTRLGRISEASDDEQEPSNHKSRKSAIRKRDSYPLRSVGVYHRHVSNRPSTHRQNNLEQQLGSLNNTSLASLFSTLTTSSGSSGNSSVTQKSYDKLTVRRRRPAKRRRSRRESGWPGRENDLQKGPKSGSRRNMEFMDEQQELGVDVNLPEQQQDRLSRPCSSASKISRKDSVQSPPTPPNRRPSLSISNSTDNEMRKELLERHDTFKSDSGISVSSSPQAQQDSEAKEHDAEADEESHSEYSDDEDDSALRPLLTARSSGTEMGTRSPMKALPDSDLFVSRLQDQEEAMKQHVLHSPRPQRNLRPPPHVTASYEPSPTLPLYDHHATRAMSATYSYPPSLPGVPHGDPTYFQSYYDTRDGQHMHAPEPPTHFNMQKTTITGYELVASKISQLSGRSEAAIKPMYRKFEMLNHRILLHLQDEIAELEEELRVLDEMIARTSIAVPEKTVQPSSRRAEARYGSELHFQRTQRLGKVFLKLQQYNQALTSYTTSTSTLPPVPKPDIAVYKEWMTKNTPIDALETRFLDQQEDLVLATPRPRGLKLKQNIAVQCLLVLLPLLVSGVAAKLSLAVAVCCVGGAVWLTGEAL